MFDVVVRGQKPIVITHDLPVRSPAAPRAAYPAIQVRTSWAELPAMRVISSGVQASSGVRSPEARISSSSRSHSGARSWMVAVPAAKSRASPRT